MKSYLSTFFTSIIILFSIGIQSAVAQPADGQIVYPDRASVTTAQDVVLWEYDTRRASDSTDTKKIIYGPDGPVLVYTEGDSLVFYFGSAENSMTYKAKDLTNMFAGGNYRLVSAGEGKRSYFGTLNENPGAFDYRLWPNVTPGAKHNGYEVDGVLYKVSYQEFWGWEVYGYSSGNQGCPVASGQPLNGSLEKCWYNGFILTKSTDGGETWVKAGSSPEEYVVASSPYKYREQSNTTRHGVFPGYADVMKVGSYYYFPVEFWGEGFKITSMMRTNDITDATTWRYWDGNDFTIENVNPYYDTVTDPSSHLPPPIENSGTLTFNPSGATQVEGLLYSSYFEKYIRVRERIFAANPEIEHGVYYHLSEDGFNWSGPQLLYSIADNAELMRDGTSNSYNFAYPTLIDYTSPGGNIGQTAYLSYIKGVATNSGLPNRDIHLVPVGFSTRSISGFTVTHTEADLASGIEPEDPNAGDGYCDNGYGQCTLITAITESEARLPWVSEDASLTISFGNSLSGTITESYAPTVTKRTQIDGSSHSGYDANDVAVTTAAWNGTLPFKIASGINISSGSGHVVKGVHLGSMTIGSASVSPSVDVIGSRIDNLSLYSAGSGGITIGGSSADSANVLGEVTFNGSGARVAGNYIGFDGTTSIVTNGNAAVTFGSSNNTLYGNVIAGATSYRLVNLGSVNATGNTIRNNYIGHLPWSASNSSFGSGSAAIGVVNADGNTITVNIISHNNSSDGEAAIFLNDADNNTITLNGIANNTGDGITVSGTSTGNTIGGSSALGNSIHSNTGYGVSFVSNTVAGNPVVGNSIYSNAEGSIGGYTNIDATPTPFVYSAFLNSSQDSLTVKFRGMGASTSDNFDVDVFYNNTGTTASEAQTLLKSGETISGVSEGFVKVPYARGTSGEITLTITDDRNVTSAVSLPRSLHTQSSTAIAAIDSSIIQAVHPNSGDVTVTSFTVSNSGDEALEWVIKEKPSWITIDTDSLTIAAGASQTIDVSLNTTELTITETVIRDTLEFYTNEAGSALGGLPFQITFYETAAPSLEVIPDTLRETFTIPTENSTGKMTFKIVKSGSQNVSYTITKNQPFITGISPAGGTLTADTTTIEVSVRLRPNDMPGTQTAMIVVRGSYGGEGQQTVVELPTYVTFQSGGGGGGGGGKAATPQFNPGPGTYSDSVVVTMSTSTQGARIVYTLDGSDPTPNSTVYSTPITLKTTGTKTIKARALADGFQDSDIAQGIYNIETSQKEIAPQPTITPSSGSYSDSVVVTMTNSNQQARMYYTNDGSTPTAQSTLYDGPFTIKDVGTFTVKAIAMIDGFQNSNVSSVTYEITEKPTASAPTFDPQGGKYNGDILITLSSSTTGALIYYTTDGSTPSLESIFTDQYNYPLAFPAPDSITVKAIATAEGHKNSQVVSQTYILTNLQKASAAVISPADGEYTDSVEVTMSSSTQGAQIYFTKDGSMPTEKSTLYEEAFYLYAEQSDSLKAIVLAEGFAPSEITSVMLEVTASIPDFSQAKDSTVEELSSTVPVTVPLDSVTDVGLLLNLNNKKESLTKTTVFFKKGTFDPKNVNGLPENTAIENVQFTSTSYKNTKKKIEYLNNDGTKLKYKGKTFTIADISSGRGFGFSSKQVALTKGISSASTELDTAAIRLTEPMVTCFEPTVEQITAAGSLENIVWIRFIADSAEVLIPTYLETDGVNEVCSNVYSFSEYAPIILDSELAGEPITFTPMADAPVITPEASAYYDSVQVSITSGEEGGSVYFTVDGTEPTQSSPAYEGTFVLKAPDTVLVRAITVATGFVTSDASQMLYTIAFTPLQTTTLAEPADGLQNVGTQTVFSWSSITGATAYELQISLTETFQTVEQVRDLTQATYTKTLEQSQTYYWRVRGYNANLVSDWSEVFSFSTGVRTSVDEDGVLPSEFILEQNYPNPFNPTTQIRFGLPVASSVSIEVYNVVGHRIAILMQNRTMHAGRHSVTFDATSLPSGLYIYKLTAGEFQQVRSMMLIR